MNFSFVLPPRVVSGFLARLGTAFEAILPVDGPGVLLPGSDIFSANEGEGEGEKETRVKQSVSDGDLRLGARQVAS